MLQTSTKEKARALEAYFTWSFTIASLSCSFPHASNSSVLPRAAFTVCSTSLSRSDHLLSAKHCWICPRSNKYARNAVEFKHNKSFHKSFWYLTSPHMMLARANISIEEWAIITSFDAWKSAKFQRFISWMNLLRCVFCKGKGWSYKECFDERKCKSSKWYSVCIKCVVCSY